MPHNIWVRDQEGMTPLMWAARRGHKDIVRTLLKNGANPNSKDRYGWSAVNWAIRKGDFKIARLLITAGATGHKGNSVLVQRELDNRQIELS